MPTSFDMQVCKVAASYGERSELGKNGEHVPWSAGTPRITCFENIPPIISEHWHILSFILLARRKQGYLVPFDWQGPRSAVRVLFCSHHTDEGQAWEPCAWATSGLCPKAHPLTFCTYYLHGSVLTRTYPLDGKVLEGRIVPSINKSLHLYSTYL